MKYLKHWNLYLETYKQMTKFYHLSGKAHLDSLLNGIDIKKSSSRNQGDGFYVSTSPNINGINPSQLTGDERTNDLMIGIEAILDEKNFDIDYELVKELPEIIDKVFPTICKNFNTKRKRKISGTYC
jgi:hypothetical protein